MVISMLKIRRPLGRLIFNMGIAIPGKTVFLIETAPWGSTSIRHQSNTFAPERCVIEIDLGIFCYLRVCIATLSVHRTLLTTIITTLVGVESNLGGRL